MRGGARPRAGRKPKGSDPAAAGEPELRKRIAGLEAENKKLRLVLAEWASERAVKKIYGKQEVATYTPHGEFCACLGCRGRG